MIQNNSIQFFQSFLKNIKKGGSNIFCLNLVKEQGKFNDIPGQKNCSQSSEMRINIFYTGHKFTTIGLSTIDSEPISKLPSSSGSGI